MPIDPKKIRALVTPRDYDDQIHPGRNDYHALPQSKRPGVQIDKETKAVLLDRQKDEAELKAVEARLKDPKNAKYATELRARRDLLARRLSTGPRLGR